MTMQCYTCWPTWQPWPWRSPGPGTSWQQRGGRCCPPGQAGRYPQSRRSSCSAVKGRCSYSLWPVHRRTFLGGTGGWDWLPAQLPGWMETCLKQSAKNTSDHSHRSLPSLGRRQVPPEPSHLPWIQRKLHDVEECSWPEIKFGDQFTLAGGITPSVVGLWLTSLLSRSSLLSSKCSMDRYLSEGENGFYFHFSLLTSTGIELKYKLV